MTELIEFEWSPEGSRFYYEVYPDNTKRSTLGQKVVYSEEPVNQYYSHWPAMGRGSNA